MTTLQAVELGVLGPLRVRQYGAPVAIPGAKPRAVLTMLGLHHGSVVAADTLVELLWGEDPPRTAAKALQTHISALRRALGDGFVLTQGTGWSLAESEVDASRYKSAVRLGRDAAATGDISQAVARFEEALALWRGIPELPDGRRGTSVKTRWIEGHAALVEDRADALLATARAAEIIGELEAAVAEAPLRERRWGQLMLALYRAGRQGDALGAYQRARTLLADELGIDPGPELRRLEAAIVAQDATLDVVVAQQHPSVMRAVTFLLTDIEGSTAAWEADAAAMAVALARHDELAEQVVTSRGGRLIKTRGEGDATFSVFERPSAAAAAAMELQDAITQEPWGLREPMRIRIALHTGEVELRDGDYFGRAVNRAARLRSLAVGGQILCSGATAELVVDSLPDDVVLADLGLRELRNLARPEHVFELRLETAEESAEQPTSDAPPMERPALPSVLIGTGPFVGRGSELERLLSAWQTSLGGGACAALIAGEPGVGKTRLAGEWSRQAYDQGAVVLYGRCDEDLGAPYQPFAEALRSMVPCVGTSRLRGLRGVEALLPLVPGLADEVPDLAAPTRADPDTERYALFDAVVALLELASTQAPIVLVLDDLHWAAKATLLLLRHLLRFGDRARVQIVGTYRSTDLDRSHPLAAMLADLHRDGTANRISLSGLDEDDVSAYVAKAGYDDEELGHALASVTGGNPFFLIEALRHVDESGGVWDPSTLPQGVREAVSRRLTRLPVETNKALAAAAVVGSRFALDLVERVVGDDLVDAFDEAAKAGIVIEEPGGRYRFNHALVRQSLLAELPSMRRMRLHQRIATTLEDEPGADDELLAELAHHYFECAWAGNAAKAVEYCRRAADQAMARLAYEGAAELYDHAVHALEELDDELPDRDDQVADLLVARCEALLAAGDVASAAGAVSQLQQATVDSARLSAWATCFDGQLSVLVHPERLDEVEAALGDAAQKLAEIDDAAGEAKAHTVRATCLARLGRVGDCEIALDDALTAARRAREHRRVNAVLASAPLAALWGPNPVPRAGGRCLDVVRLLRITTDSPAVEATSTRCQAVLEAFRGRDAAARRMIDSAGRTVTELGLRHARLEVEQFAGIVELVLDDPAAAEPRLRKAYNGFRRMGLDADTAETAALLGRVCLALNRDVEADELCTESERLAGHALKAAIAWRTVRAQLLSRGADHKEARRVAEAAVALAERTDALVDHGDACLALATVLGGAGDAAGARAAAERAANLYERKGAAALAERARRMLDEPVQPIVPTSPETPVVQPRTAAVQASERVAAAIGREDWDGLERLFAPEGAVESRRKVVGFKRNEFPANEVMHQTRQDLEAGILRLSHVVIAARGDRLALARVTLGTADESPGAPQDELLQLYDVDEEGRISLQIWFDVADIDAAMAELDAMQAQRLETAASELENACVRALRRAEAATNRGDWGEVEQVLGKNVNVESRRKIIGFTQTDDPSANWAQELRRLSSGMGQIHYRHTVLAIRGERAALVRMAVGTPDASPGDPESEMLQVYGIDTEGQLSLHIWFDIDDMDAALAELDAVHARFEEERSPARRPENTASQVDQRFWRYFPAHDWDAMAEILTEDFSLDDRRRALNSGIRRSRDAEIENLKVMADVIGRVDITLTVIATRGERLALRRLRFSAADQTPEGFYNEFVGIVETSSEGELSAHVVFDSGDVDAAIAELDARYLAAEAAAYARAWSVIAGTYAAVGRNEFPAITPDCIAIDHRRATSFGPGEVSTTIRAGWDLGHIRPYVEVVHRLSDFGAVCSYAAHGVSHQGFDAEWQGVNVVTVDGDLVNRTEFFDETDLDAAVARFDQLSQSARPLENTASRANARLIAYANARDWDAATSILAEDHYSDDRRRVTGAGIRRGPDADIEQFRVVADLGANITVEVIATRGDRLVLTRNRVEIGDKEQPFIAEFLGVVETDLEGRIAAVIELDLEDEDAAFAELDTRYAIGEAAAHAHTWSAVTNCYAAVNRREIPATTRDFVSLDHRKGTPFAPGDVIAYTRASWSQVPDLSYRIDAVHQLSDLGAVITHTVGGTSQEGFEAEWREIHLMILEGDQFTRSELFDEAEIHATLAKFDDLSQPEKRLENAASRVGARYLAHFAAGDWDSMPKILADNFCNDDRRPVVGSGVLVGRDAEVANERAIAELWTANVNWTVMATRGSRLSLARLCFSGRDEDPEAFLTETLTIAEINADEQIVAFISFGIDDFDAAIEELDARYLAGEAAAHAKTWSVITRANVALNQRKLFATTPDWANIDHRRGTSIAPGEMASLFQAAWNVTSDLSNFIEVIHRLDNFGAVISHVANETSQGGFHAEWRVVSLLTLDGELVSRCEVFDEADLDTALARFEELHPHPPQLENAASRVDKRFQASFAARDWDVMATMLSDGFSIEDRRRVVNMGNLQGRDAEIGVHSYAVVGSENVTSTVIATRAQRLTLNQYRFSGGDQRPDAFRIELLAVVEIDADERMATVVVFDADDIDAAIAELDSRYLVGEAAAHTDTWSVISGSYAAINRNEMPLTTPDCVNIDRRRELAMGVGDLIAYISAVPDRAQDSKVYVEVVHRLAERGAVVTYAAHGTSQEGFDAEWRGIAVLTVDGELVDRTEIFDEADLDAALARFDELSRPTLRLENTATRAFERLYSHVAADEWDAVAQITAENVSVDDRRRVVNAGTLHGRDANIKDAQATVGVGFTMTMLDVVATRGDRLALTGIRVSGRDPEAIQNDAVEIIEIDAEERVAGVVVFDLEDFNAAIAELDARYAAGEAAAHSETWSAIAEVYAALNRGEMPAIAPDLVDIDHRSLAAIGSGDLMAYLQSALDEAARPNIYIETVHRLTDLGAVITHVAKATSREGFDAEWRITSFFVVSGDRVNRYEIFDEDDLEAAFARFDELHGQPPRLENTAAQAYERIQAHFAARDWDGLAEALAEEVFRDDRRRLVGAELRKGRHAAVAEFSALAEIGVRRLTFDTIAIRGSRLLLSRSRASGRDPRADAFRTDVLTIVELDADERMAAIITFDPDDFDATIAELDARYLAGEAAPYSAVWSVVMEGYAALNRHERPLMTSDVVSVDHRRGRAFAPGDLPAFIDATWELMPQSSFYIEDVHRLNDIGVVITHVVRGTTAEGFDAEWRQITVLKIAGDRLSRCEMFDEEDLDAALASFEQFGRPARRLENTASQVYDRLNGYFAARNWAAMAEAMTANIIDDDRQRMVNSGTLRGRDAVITNARTGADLGTADFTSTVIATRGDRLALCRTCFFGRGPNAFRSEALHIAEIEADERVVAHISFDVENIDAAIAELDARYVAGEAAAHARTWTVVAKSYASISRQELPAISPGSVFVDHRRSAAFGTADLSSYIRAGWDLGQDVRPYVEAVYRLSDLGAVCSYAAQGVSHEGFDAEWQGINLTTVDGDMVNRCEFFNEDDLEAALATFDQLTRPAPRLENAASQAYDRFRSYFAARDWAAMAELLTADSSVDDHRRVVNAENRRGRDAEIANMRPFADIGTKTSTATIIATRGEHLALCRTCITGEDPQPGGFRIEMLIIVETTADKQILARVAYDPDDFDAAFEELDARYLAGEAATHAHTWSVITRGNAAANRNEALPMTPDSSTIDHRLRTTLNANGVNAYLRASWDLTPDFQMFIESVHRLSDLGAVVTHASHGISQDDFEAEWRQITLLTVEGDLGNRCEIFDEANLDTALARFDELQSRTPRVENAASRVADDFQAYYAAGDWPAMAEMLAEDYSSDDRRRVVGSGVRYGRDAHLADMRARAELWLRNRTSTVMATRGERLALIRIRMSDPDQGPDAFVTELLILDEINADERLAAGVAFDLDDFDSAIAELDRRYLAGEAGAYSQTWSVITQAYTELNRGELPTMTSDFGSIDHRRTAAMAPGELIDYLRVALDQIPRLSIYIEAVHQLSSSAAVVTHAAAGSSREGFYAEWRSIELLTVEGDRINRCEIFDEADLDAALARFEELRPRAPRLENAAIRVSERLFAGFAAGEWDSIRETLADDFSQDDRRRVVGAGVRQGRDEEIADLRAIANLWAGNATGTYIATRGERLDLMRLRFSRHDQGDEAFVTEVLGVGEINADERIVAAVSFDPEDVGAAFEELDARYLAGEAATHSHTWSVIMQACAALNRREIFATTADFVDIDHRSLAAIESGDLKPYIRAALNDGVYNVYVEAVHRLGDLGAVVTLVSSGTSQEGFDGEWRMADIFTVEGDLISRCEIFDEADLDAALARFDELDRPASP